MVNNQFLNFSGLTSILFLINTMTAWQEGSAKSLKDTTQAHTADTILNVASHCAKRRNRLYRTSNQQLNALARGDVAFNSLVRTSPRPHYTIQGRQEGGHVSKRWENHNSPFISPWSLSDYTLLSPSSIMLPASAPLFMGFLHCVAHFAWMSLCKHCS